MLSAKIKILNRVHNMIVEKSLLNMNREQVIEMLDSCYTDYEIISIEVTDLTELHSI